LIATACKERALCTYHQLLLPLLLQVLPYTKHNFIRFEETNIPGMGST
jgi:hypothetical protein